MKENRRPTLKSIAQAAGVDPSTVSRALRGERGSGIPEHTMERIRRAAEDQGYEANPWARSLRTQRAMMIGLAVPRLTDIVLAQMFEAAQERVRSLGYETITVSGDEQDPGHASVHGLIERRVDGLILATANLDAHSLDAFADIPFILLNRASGSYPVVRGDDELGGYLATRHLLEMGHRRIAHLAGPRNVSTSRLRLDGYRRALTEFDVPFDSSLVAYSEFDTRSALPAADQLLDKSHPTAMFCVNDFVAIAAMSKARDRGLRLPDDLAVVGYNDTEVAPLLSTPLSTVRMPLQEMGALAADMIFELMDGHVPESVVLRPELIIRASSSRPS